MLVCQVCVSPLRAHGDRGGFGPLPKVSLSRRRFPCPSVQPAQHPERPPWAQLGAACPQYHPPGLYPSFDKPSSHPVRAAAGRAARAGIPVIAQPGRLAGEALLGGIRRARWGRSSLPAGRGCHGERGVTGCAVAMAQHQW